MGKRFVRPVKARGKTYWYWVEKIKMLSGKYVEHKIRRLTKDEIKQWVEAQSRLAKYNRLAKEAGGISGLRLNPIGYTVQDRGSGFYKLKPKPKEGRILITKDHVFCGSCRGWDCDHVKAAELALGRKKGSP